MDHLSRWIRSFATGLAFYGLILSPSVKAQFARPVWSLKPLPGSRSGQAVSPLDPISPIASTAVRPAWPSPSLNPGIPSGFIANWGDVFVSGSAATAGAIRGNVDGSWVAGLGFGDAAKAVALEVAGGCGSVKNFCSNGGSSARISRLLVNAPTAKVALAGAWQNGIQWGNEGRQDNIYSATLSYALPLRPGSAFGQTLQINAGVGNSSFAPYSEENSESKVGAFGSIGVELSPAVGVAAGWSGRGVNAQLSYAPFGDTPLTLNLLGVDLLNQTPDGAIGVFAVSWGTNFATPSF